MLMKISDIKPNPDNPRVIKDDNFKKLVQSLKDFPEMAEVREIVLNKDNVILGGNMRYKAMIEAGWSEAPVKVVDWPEDKQKEFIVKDNVSGGDWDYDILANQYELEQLDAWGVDLPEYLNPEDEIEEDEAPEVDEQGEPVSKLGEIYQLGRHRVMCGDATVKENVEQLMNGVKADMVFTDPPYNTQMQQGRTSKEWGIIENDNMSVSDFGLFCKTFVANLYAYSKPNTDKYICMGWSAYNLLYEAMPNVKNCIVWVKNNFGLGHGYRPQHEFIVYDGGTLEANNESNVWNENKDASTSYKHPTQKPTAIPARAIKNSSKTEDVVLDLFIGSGSTLIACEQTDRTCYGMELYPKYVDVIRKRYHKFVTGSEEGWEDGTSIA